MQNRHKQRRPSNSSRPQADHERIEGNGRRYGDFPLFIKDSGDFGEFEIRTLWDLFCVKSRNCVTKCVPIKMGGYTMGTQIKGSSHKKWGQKEKLTVT